MDVEAESFSIHEVRRKAPLHYWAKADNARFTAYILSKRLNDEFLEEAKESIGYSGSPWIAVWECYYREISVALELIVKAVIAKKLQLGIAPKYVTKVRTVHDVPSLWADAGLPLLSTEDRRRLVMVKSYLNWASRYAAPKTDEQFYKEQREEAALRPYKAPGEFRIERPFTIGFEDFDRMYSVAAFEFGECEAKG